MNLKHPTPEQLAPLIKAVDVTCWALAVKEHSKSGACRVDVKGALQDLCEAWSTYQLAVDDSELMIAD